MEGGLRGGIEVHEAVVLGPVDEVMGRGVVLHDERRLADLAEQRGWGRTMGTKAEGRVPFAMCWQREKGDDVVMVVVEVRGLGVEDDIGGLVSSRRATRATICDQTRDKQGQSTGDTADVVPSPFLAKPFFLSLFVLLTDKRSSGSLRRC